MRRLLAMLTAGVALALHPAASRAQTGTASPHGALDMPCAQCHLPDAWRPTKISSAFKHAPGVFPLEGAHASAACTSCHNRLDFTGVSTTCGTCHRDPHQGELGGGANCGTCHSSRSFLDLAPMRRTHQVSAFPLTGAHAAVDCLTCHTPRAPGQLAFVNISTSCQSCHLATYQATTSPPHASAGFATTCATCHSTASWSGKSFDHSVTRFPLTGAHTTLACTACHGDGVYAGKPTTCVSCHQADYNGATDPSHTAAAFPTDCASSGCHTTTAWTGAKFTQHDATFFPIYSGAHAGRWSSCATCHATATNFAVFDCLSCHGMTQTNAQHVGRTGYVYASPNCYACHPRGSGG